MNKKQNKINLEIKAEKSLFEEISFEWVYFEKK